MTLTGRLEKLEGQRPSWQQYESPRDMPTDVLLEAIVDGTKHKAAMDGRDLTEAEWSELSELAKWMGYAFDGNRWAHKWDCHENPWV